MTLTLTEARARVALLSPQVIEKIKDANARIGIAMATNKDLTMGVIITVHGFTHLLKTRFNVQEADIEGLLREAGIVAHLFAVATQADIPEELVEAWIMVQQDAVATMQAEADGVQRG